MYRIRPADPTDIPGLAELGAKTFVETFGTLYSPEDLAYYLNRVYSIDGVQSDMSETGMQYCVAERDDAMVGYCKIGPVKVPVPAPASPASAGELRQLYVLQSHQGHGLGTRLLEWAMQEFHRRKTTSVYVSVWSENLGAQRLYERHGFRWVGEYAFMVGQQADREFIMQHDLVI